MNKIEKLILASIIILGIFLRFINLSDNPKAMYGDELTLIYDSYSLLNTAHDQKGAFLPLVFAQGGGRPGGYVYATIPIVALLGPTALAVRLLSALSGVGLILIIFLLSKRLFNQKTALFGAFFMAISPWDLALSRGGFETHLALFLSLTGFYLFLKFKDKKWWLIPSGLLFGYAIQTYPTYRLLIPVFVAGLLVFETILRKDWWKNIKLPLIFFLIFVYSSAFLGVFMTFDSRQPDRFSTINVFSDRSLTENLKQKINLESSIDPLPYSLVKLIHNKPLEYLGILGNDYFENLNPNFLFLHGDGTPRHNPALMGEMYMVDFIFLIFGIVFLFKKDIKLLVFIIGWLLLAPIPAALIGGPHALRDSFMIPPLILISGLGASYIWSKTTSFKFQPVRLILAVALFVQFIFLIDRIYFLSPTEYSYYWSYGGKVAAQIAIANASQYDYVLISTQIESAEFTYPVYGKIDPNLVILENQNLNQTKLDGLYFRRYGNVFIGNIPNTMIDQLVKDLPGKVLFIGLASQGNGLINHFEISGTDKMPLLTIVTKPYTTNIR